MKQAQLWHNTKEATTFTVAFSMDHGPLDMLIVQAAKTDAVLPEQRTHLVTSVRHVLDRKPRRSHEQSPVLGFALSLPLSPGVGRDPQKH